MDKYVMELTNRYIVLEANVNEIIMAYEMFTVSISESQV